MRGLGVILAAGALASLPVAAAEPAQHHAGRTRYGMGRRSGGGYRRYSGNGAREIARRLRQAERDRERQAVRQYGAGDRDTLGAIDDDGNMSIVTGRSRRGRYIFGPAMPPEPVAAEPARKPRARKAKAEA